MKSIATAQPDLKAAAAALAVLDTHMTAINAHDEVKVESKRWGMHTGVPA